MVTKSLNFIGNRNGDIIRPVCIKLPQMSGFIRYFDYSRKNMSFMTRDSNVSEKFNEVWGRIKELIGKKNFIASLSMMVNT